MYSKSRGVTPHDLNVDITPLLTLSSGRYLKMEFIMKQNLVLMILKDMGGWMDGWRVLLQSNTGICRLYLMIQ